MFEAIKEKKSFVIIGALATASLAYWFWNRNKTIKKV